MPFRVEGAGIGGTIPSLPGVPFVPWFCFSPFIFGKIFGRWDNP